MQAGIVIALLVAGLWWVTGWSSSDRRTVYPAACPALDSLGATCSVPLTGVYPTVPYRVDFATQQVVAIGAIQPFRLDRCTVFDADNWVCVGRPDTTSWDAMNDGEYHRGGRVAGEAGAVYVHRLTWWRLRLEHGYAE